MVNPSWCRPANRKKVDLSRIDVAIKEDDHVERVPGSATMTQDAGPNCASHAARAPAANTAVPARIPTVRNRPDHVTRRGNAPVRSPAALMPPIQQIDPTIHNATGPT
jgi:hypothetical protein